MNKIAIVFLFSVVMMGQTPSATGKPADPSVPIQVPDPQPTHPECVTGWHLERWNPGNMQGGQATIEDFGHWELVSKPIVVQYRCVKNVGVLPKLCGYNHDQQCVAGSDDPTTSDTRIPGVYRLDDYGPYSSTVWYSEHSQCAGVFTMEDKWYGSTYGAADHNWRPFTTRTDAARWAEGECARLVKEKQEIRDHK